MHKPKETKGSALIAGINAIRFIGSCFRSKGGQGHISILRTREEGQAAPEYALLLALMAATLVVAYTSLGTATAHLFTAVVSHLGP